MITGRSLTSASHIDRSKTDFYPTPPQATLALLGWLIGENAISKTETVWEPACGQGHISEVIKQFGINTYSTDKYDDSYSPELLDFLTVGENPAESDWIITNPPFSEAEEFIRKSLEFGTPFAMLLKSQYWHSSRRRKLFEETNPSAVLPLTWRPDFQFGARGGSPTMEVQWTVWGIGGSNTRYEPLAKPTMGAVGQEGESHE